MVAVEVADGGQRRDISGSTSRALVADLDGRYLSAEIAAPFVGRILGLYATTGTVTLRAYSYRGSEPS